jgi:hypothetical protein
MAMVSEMQALLSENVTEGFPQHLCPGGVPVSSFPPLYQSLSLKGIPGVLR